MWLVGVVVRRYIDILIIIINFPYSTCIRSFFGSSILTSLFIFKMFFRSLYIHSNIPFQHVLFLTLLSLLLFLHHCLFLFLLPLSLLLLLLPPPPLAALLPLSGTGPTLPGCTLLPPSVRSTSCMLWGRAIR